ncbi:hypothetical protein [Flammeovirga aprica]|uniref:Uncharacterized protein n=1 Tax=Flammeovirga aprica JL-4 TaxID=694437 RepID=A0A7X9P057_9BACT|nr:hypothetical protein [Flammeovirga aprica]NME66577.1 hypothetical protein [Flammeovirga aprica JL-4]
MLLKHIFSLIVFILLANLSFSQTTYTVKITPDGTFVSSYRPNNNSWGGGMPHIENIRLGPSGTSSFKSGLDKCLKWAKLNKTHKREFEKYVIRFKYMNTHMFNQFGYSSQMADDATLVFEGKTNGGFNVTLKEGNGNAFGSIFYFDSLKDLQEFRNLFNKKSSDIDSIFN